MSTLQPYWARNQKDMAIWLLGKMSLKPEAVSFFFLLALTSERIWPTSSGKVCFFGLAWELNLPLGYLQQLSYHFLYFKLHSPNSDIYSENSVLHDLIHNMLDTALDISCA